ncbi:MAG TPA: FMN-binding protein, partial [Planctomycetes bacterium]|nr:FMN-binding protein [Planctomycetota bacterium]
LYVLDQKETPGLGSYIQDKERFLGGFEGQPADKPLRVVKGRPAPRSGEIRAITGATISSLSVCHIVNRAVRDFRKALAGREGKD